MACFTDAFLQERIDKTKELIVLYEDAVSSLVTGKILSYTIDTGQTRQTVTKNDVVQLNTQIDSLYNRLATLCARLDGSGTVTVVPLA